MITIVIDELHRYDERYRARFEHDARFEDVLTFTFSASLGVRYTFREQNERAWNPPTFSGTFTQIHNPQHALVQYRLESDAFPVMEPATFDGQPVVLRFARVWLFRPEIVVHLGGLQT